MCYCCWSDWVFVCWLFFKKRKEKKVCITFDLMMCSQLPKGRCIDYCHCEVILQLYMSGIYLCIYYTWKIYHILNLYFCVTFFRQKVTSWYPSCSRKSAHSCRTVLSSNKGFEPKLSSSSCFAPWPVTHHRHSVQIPKPNQTDVNDPRPSSITSL